MSEKKIVTKFRKYSFSIIKRKGLSTLSDSSGIRGKNTCKQDIKFLHANFRVIDHVMNTKTTLYDRPTTFIAPAEGWQGWRGFMSKQTVNFITKSIAQIIAVVKAAHYNAHVQRVFGMVPEYRYTSVYNYDRYDLTRQAATDREGN